jgi:hypothetical protein
MAEDLTQSLKSIAEEIKASTAKISAESARNAELAGAEKKKSTEEIKTLSTELSELVKTQNSLQEKLSGLSGLDKLTQTLKDQKTAVKLDLDVAELGNKLQGLNSFFGESNEASKELLEQFKLQKAILQNPKASEEEKALAEKTIEAISEGAQTEEDRREAAKKVEEANSILSQMASGLDGLGDKFDKFSNNFKKGAGFLGTLGAIGLLLFDPETLKNMVIGVIEFFEDMYATVRALLDGDWETAKNLVMENLGGIGLALGAIAIFFGGSIFRGISAIVKTVKAIGSGISKVGKAFAAVGKIMSKTFAPVTDKIKSTFTKVGDIFRKFGKTFVTVGDESSKFSKFGSILKNVFKRIFFPITLIMGIFDAVKGALAGFEEGGIIGGIRGALIGLFDGIIGGAVNMLTGAVAWILDKLGFDKAAEALSSFDITEYFTRFIDGIGSMISGVVDWIKDTFAGFNVGEALSALFNGIFGEGGLYDILFAPIDAAINWVMGVFGFEAPEGGFSLREMIGTVIENVKNFFIDLFDFLPSIDSIKESITNLLPSWLKPDEEINIATANEEQLRAMAKDNAGFFGDEDKEYEKLVAEKQAATQTQLDTTPKEFVDSKAQNSQANEILKRTPKEFVDSKMEDSQANEILKRTPKEFIQQTQTEAAENNEVLARGQQALDTRPSDYISKLEKRPAVLDKQKVMNENESAMKAAAAAPIIINNNNNSGGKGGNSTNNVSSATYNISQGISADDFVKADFANRY